MIEMDGPTNRSARKGNSKKGRTVAMTPQEKTLYHQIHPLKLATDSSAEVVSLSLFWQRKLLAGLVVLLVPPILASTLIIRRFDLEAYKQSAFGRYLPMYMTTFAVMVRLPGTVMTHLGAVYRRPRLIVVGLVIILLAWSRDIIWPKSPEEHKEALQAKSHDK
jgi:hypothetical protein